MPCPDCGASAARGEEGDHVCERERWLDYKLFVRRAEVVRFEDDLAAYFDSPEGRSKVREAESGRDAKDAHDTDEDETEA